MLNKKASLVSKTYLKNVYDQLLNEETKQKSPSIISDQSKHQDDHIIEKAGKKNLKKNDESPDSQPNKISEISKKYLKNTYQDLLYKESDKDKNMKKRRVRNRY